MSEKQEAVERDDRAALTALARLAVSQADVPVPRAAAGTDEGPVREYLETLGLLPYGLEPETPNPEIKERLMAEISAAAEAGAPQRQFDEITLAGSVSEPVDVTLQGRTEPDRSSANELGSSEPEWPQPVTAPAGTIPFPVERQAPPPAPRSQSLWVGALAAALVLCVAGLGFLAGKVTEQSRTIASLEGELQSLPVDDMSAMEADLARLQRRFNMVTTVARRAYPLEGLEARDRPIDGIVYVCGHHQRWYLNVQGLDPAPPGKEYHLWFVTNDGMVDGGVLPVEDLEEAAEMEAPSMPDGTHGFAVTLEELGADGDSPSGIMVMLGEESVSL